MNRLLLCLVLILLGTSAQAQKVDYHSGNYFLPLCKLAIADTIPKNADIMGIGQCAGVIQALASTGAMYRTDARYCVPENATLKQIAQVVINYLERKPQNLHFDFVGLAQTALREAWPCR